MMTKHDHTFHHGRLAVAVTAFLLLLFGGGMAQAQEPSLSVSLHVTAAAGAGEVGAEVVAGLAFGATDAFDPDFDTLAFELGALQAWFYHAEAPERARKLRRDFRAGGGESAWVVQVTAADASPGSTVAEGTPVTLSWDPAASDGTCGGRTLWLTDLSGDGGVVDMTVERSLVFPSPAPGQSHDFRLVIADGGGDAQPPAAPARVYTPLSGRSGVLLVWDAVPSGVIGYHVERSDAPGSPNPVYKRLTRSPVQDTRWLDETAAGMGAVGYRVVSVSGGGCESAPSQMVVAVP